MSISRNYPSTYVSSDLMTLLGNSFGIVEDQGEYFLDPDQEEFEIVKPEFKGANVVYTVLLKDIFQPLIKEADWQSAKFCFDPQTLKLMKIITKEEILARKFAEQKNYFISISSKKASAAIRISKDLARNFKLTSDHQLAYMEDDDGRQGFIFSTDIDGFSLYEGVEDGTLGFNSEAFRDFCLNVFRLRKNYTHRLYLEPITEGELEFIVVNTEVFKSRDKK